MRVKIFNYANKMKILEVPDFDKAVVEIISGDEIIVFYKNGHMVYNVDSADVFEDPRKVSDFEGRYVVSGSNVEPWANFTYRPRHHETVSYVRQHRFYSQK